MCQHKRKYVFRRIQDMKKKKSISVEAAKRIEPWTSETREKRVNEKKKITKQVWIELKDVRDTK